MFKAASKTVMAKTAGSVDGIDSCVVSVGSSGDSLGGSSDGVDSSSGSIHSSSNGGNGNSVRGNGGTRAATTTVRFGPLKTSENLVIPLKCAIAIYVRIHKGKLNTGV